MIGTLTVEQHALVVGDDRFNEQLQPIYERGFECRRVESLDKVPEALSADLTVVVADVDNLGPTGREQLKELREADDKVLVFGVTSHGASTLSFGFEGPDAVLEEPVDPDKFELQLKSILKLEQYDGPAADAIVDAVANALRGFGFEMVLSRATLRTSRASFAKHRSCVAFVGPAVAGHIIVGAGSESVEAVLEKLSLGNDWDVAPTDLIGEICNQVTGAFKRHMLQLGLGFSIGVPIPDTHELVTRVSRAALALTFSDGEVEVIVELGLARLETKLATPVDQEVADPDDIFFFDDE